MQVTDKIDPTWWDLFDPDTPNDVILRSVLSERCPGLAYLDRLRDPTQILVRAHGGKAFASAGAREAFLHETVDSACRLGWTALADTEVPESVRRRGRVVDRVRFEDCDLESETLRTLRDGLPRDFEISPLDCELLERCHHALRELPEVYGDHLDSYFDFGYGVCLLHDGEVVSEAYGGFVADGRMEAIAGTTESLRRRGLATIASAYLAEEARVRGHTFTWNCLADNVGSLKVARHLGFRTERHYREICFAPYRFVPMTASYAEEIGTWHYPGIYAFYDLDQDPEDRCEFMDPASWPERYFTVLDGTEDLVGFFSFEREEETLVVGLGLRPNRTGRGWGTAFVSAGLDFARDRFTPSAFGLSVASFNRRAIRVYEQLGFTRTRTFQQETNGGTYEFVEMRRAV